MNFLRPNKKSQWNDICQVSLGWLRSRVVPLIQQRVSSEYVWIPDDSVEFPPETLQTLDVLLLGGFFKRLLECHDWNASSYRIWSLSPAVKNVMLQLFGFNENEVGVMSRYEIAEVKPALHEPQLQNWVFAGRISPTKNIEFLLRTVNALQNIGFPLQLHIFGKADNMVSLDRGCVVVENFEKHIFELVETLHWSVKPKFYGLVEPEQWLRVEILEPTLVNFSTFMSEDFDVSLAQAQEASWPAIVSDWGGHRDSRGAVLKIPWQMLAASDETSNSIQMKAEILAQYLQKQFSQGLRFEKNFTNTAKNEIPDPISHERLIELRTNFLKSLGPQGYLLIKDGLGPFSGTSKGIQLFSKYRQVFGEPNRKIDHVVVTNDLNARSDELNRKIFTMTSEICQQLAKSESVFLIASRDLMLPENLELLFNAKNIHFSFKLPESLKILRELCPQAQLHY